MSLAKFAATQQVAFTASVREFLRQVVLRLVPKGNWSRIPIDAGDREFDRKLTGALKSVSENDSADEVRRKVIVVLIEEVSRLAETVSDACLMNGYGQYASRYFSAARFVRLLESCDKRVIGALKVTISNPAKDTVQAFREIGAILDGTDPEGISVLDPYELFDAQMRVGKVVETMAKSIRLDNCGDIREVVEAVGEKIGAKVSAEIDGKLGKLGRNGKKQRHGKQLPEEMVAAAKRLWTRYRLYAKNEMKHNRRAMYRDAYNAYKSELAEVGIMTVESFCRIMHALRNREYRKRLKNLHGRDAAAPAAAPAAAAKKLAETPSQPAVENDIISDVDNTLFPLVVLLMSMLANTASNGAVEGDSFDPSPPTSECCEHTS